MRCYEDEAVCHCVLIIKALYIGAAGAESVKGALSHDCSITSKTS